MSCALYSKNHVKITDVKDLCIDIDKKPLTDLMCRTQKVKPVYELPTSPLCVDNVQCTYYISTHLPHKKMVIDNNKKKFFPKIESLRTVI